MNFVYRISTGFLFIILLASFSFAQNPIPNAGFEDWTMGSPDEWITWDIQGITDAVTESGTSHSGSAAAKGEVVEYVGEIIPPYLASNPALIAISQNYSRLTGYYQFSNNGEDALYVLVQLFDAEDLTVAGGSGEFGQTSGGYTQFAVDIEYIEGSNPAAKAFIVLGIDLESESELESISLGSYFLIDDIAFDMASAISDDSFGNTPKTYQLDQNHPNPFNPTTSIDFSIPQAGKVRLSVYNSIGQEVEMLVDDNLSAGDHRVTFNADNLPSGIYFYKLQSDNYVNVKKMMLIR